MLRKIPVKGILRLVFLHHVQSNWGDLCDAMVIQRANFFFKFCGFVFDGDHFYYSLNLLQHSVSLFVPHGLVFGHKECGILAP